MKKEKKIRDKARIEIMNIVSVQPEEYGKIGYLKLTDEEIDKIVDLIERIYQEGFEAGQHEATPQYKKDMRDAYEKGKRDAIEGVKRKIIASILMWTEKNNEWDLNREIKKKLAELDL